MIKCYRIEDITNAPKKKIKPNKKYGEVCDYLYPDSTLSLPDDVVWYVKKGNKWSDQIPYHEAELHKFFSKRVVDLLSTLMPMQGRCYPIHIVGEDIPEEPYYFLHDLPAYPFLWPTDCLYDDYMNHPWLFLLPEDGTLPTGMFLFKGGGCYLVDEDTMRRMKKLKLTNIAFEEVYGLTQKEWDNMHHINNLVYSKS